MRRSEEGTDPARPNRLKTASALQKWLAGDIDVEKLREEMLSEASSNDESSRQVKYFLDSRLPNRLDAVAQCSAPQQREVAERTMLFLASDAEYRWPKVGPKILDLARTASTVVFLVGVALVVLGLLGAVVGLILWLVLGAYWLLVVPATGIAVGIVLSIVGFGAGVIVAALWHRRLEAIWDQTRDRATLDLNFAFYPFADSRQFQKAESRRAEILNSLASETRQAALSEEKSNRIEEATREHERIRQQALTDAAGRNPRRCPNCGARDYRRARQSNSESDPIVMARECKRCGCVWRRAWSKGEACLAIVLGCLVFVTGVVLLVEAVLCVTRGERAMVVMGLFSVAGIWYAWASLLREGWRVLHGRGQLGEVFKPGEPIGQEDVKAD